MQHKLRAKRSPAIVVAISLGCWPVWAQDSLPPLPPEDGPVTGENDAGLLPDLPPDDLADDSLDSGGAIDLLYEDFDVVVSASRTSRSSAVSAVPVSVLDANAIRYSGVEQFGELLQFIPGVDAVQVGRNQFLVGVRGFHQSSSDRALLLHNGRVASDPLSGGLELQQQPFFLHDIERIEVVRGPASGAWGANALSGVINVIDKSPRDTAGVFGLVRSNEYGDVRTDLRVGEAGEEFAWRLSAEFVENEALNEPIGAVAPSAVFGPSGDFSRSRRIGFNGVWDATDSSELEFGASYVRLERGAFPTLSVQELGDDRIDQFRSHAKYLFEDGDTSGYVQWYGTYAEQNRPNTWIYDAFDQTVELQLNRTFGNHELTGGLTARFVNATVSRDRPGNLLNEATLAEQWIGGFLGDRWTINDRWTLEAQGRLDWYSETELDWAARVALLRSLDDQGAHTLRVAGAKSFRTPQRTFQGLAAQAIPVAPGVFAVNLIEPDIRENEEVYSAELGYSGRLAPGFTARVDTFYQRYQDMTGNVALPEPAPALGRIFSTVGTSNSAHAWGAELELAYKADSYEFTGWYTYQDLELDNNAGGIRAYLPAEHKAGFRALYRPIDSWALSGNFSYTSGSESPSGLIPTTLPETYRFDLASTFEPWDGRLGFQIGVRDLFDESDSGLITVVSPTLTQPGLGRTVFAELRFEF